MIRIRIFESESKRLDLNEIHGIKIFDNLECSDLWNVAKDK